LHRDRPARRLQSTVAMAMMLVTCPESAHLEQIEYEDDPAGLLIRRCTAFPGNPVCPRTCAARLDTRRRSKRLADGTVLVAVSCLWRRGTA
jgi:hypothetical protein